MINELRDKFNTKIKLKQDKKEELYNDISRIDNELLELNEMLLKVSDNDAFFKITPNEAFEILKVLGYEDENERLEVYISLISSKKEEKISENKIDFDIPNFFKSMDI